MHTQIRLAERQGLLRGIELSEVQEEALVLLDLLQQYHQDRLERDQRRRDIALLGWASDGLAASWDARVGWLRFKELFPDYVPQQVSEPVVAISSEREIDEVLAINGSGESQPAFYDFSEADEISEADAIRMLNEALAQSTGGLNVQTARDEGWI